MRVNFLIIGAQKCGTSALAAFLEEHPDVCMADRKEVHYFDYEEPFEGETVDYDAYHRAFSKCGGQPAIGEATPVYLYFPQVARRIWDYNPRMRLIVMLRDPIDRAFSHYQMAVARGEESLPFLAACLVERRRLIRSQGDYRPESSLRLHSYLDRGRYARQIGIYFRRFPQEQFLILFSEELRNDHDATLRKVYRFLDIREVDLPAPRLVFSQEYRRMFPLAKFLLRRVYAAETRRIELLLKKRFPGWLS